MFCITALYAVCLSTSANQSISFHPPQKQWTQPIDKMWEEQLTSNISSINITIRYDTMQEFNLDQKAESDRLDLENKCQCMPIVQYRTAQYTHIHYITWHGRII